jgi:CubicO group peptidase (beta-lactamase class C family)
MIAKKIIPVLFAMLLIGCSPSQEIVTATPEPPATPSPTEELFDQSILDEFHTEISSGTYGYINRFILIRKGQVFFDQTYQHDYHNLNAGKDTPPGPYNYHDTEWHPYYQSRELHTLQSVTKSITALLMGIAIERGEIPGTDVPVLDYFDTYQIEELDEAKGAITLEDLLTMRSGLFWDEWTYPLGDPRNSVTQLESSQDWIQYTLDLPILTDPGEVWVYNSGASQLLSGILKEATGLPADEYAEEYLFNPVGIKDYYWKKTPSGLADTEGGLYLRAEDLAKIGTLILQNGVWEGKQIVSRDWIEAMTSPQVPDVAPSDPYWNYGYGYLWWLLPNQNGADVIAALGYGGQFLFIVPELDLIAVFNGWNIYGTSSSIIRDAFLEIILPATK